MVLLRRKQKILVTEPLNLTLFLLKTTQNCHIKKTLKIKIYRPADFKDFLRTLRIYFFCKKLGGKKNKFLKVRRTCGLLGFFVSSIFFSSQKKGGKKIIP